MFCVMGAGLPRRPFFLFLPAVRGFIGKSPFIFYIPERLLESVIYFTNVEIFSGANFTMDDSCTKELVRAFAPKRKREYHIEPFVPLEMELWPERLLLTEMQMEAQSAGRAASDPDRELEIAAYCTPL